MSDLRPVQTAERVAWVDCAKGIGIILVVVGHVLRGLQKTPAAVPGFAAIDSWIYAFHMPLFFFLSGLFLERSTSQPLGGFIGARVRRIIWPYLIWSWLQETFRHISRNPDALAFRDFWTIVYRPVMQFWFLYVLFFLLIFYVLWRKVGRGWWSFAILALLLNLSMDFGVNYGPWGVIYQMWMNIPYLALGVVFSESGGMRLAGNMRSVRLGALIVAGYAVVTAAVRLAGWPLDFLAVPVASTGIAASCAAAIVASRLQPALGFLDRGARVSFPRDLCGPHHIRLGLAAGIACSRNFEPVGSPRSRDTRWSCRPACALDHLPPLEFRSAFFLSGAEGSGMRFAKDISLAAGAWQSLAICNRQGRRSTVRSPAPWY